MIPADLGVRPSARAAGRGAARPEPGRSGAEV